jgi:YihY family inner membrane protein
MWIDNLAVEFRKLHGLKWGRWAALVLPSVRYLFETEVHAYAFSIAANAYLSFFPFTLIMLVICRRWLHWESAYQMVLQLLRVSLPTGGDFMVRNLQVVVQGRPRLQVISVLMLFFTSSGVFLPLEIALNKVWGIQANRSFLRNQAMSFSLALVSGVLSLCFILAVTPVEAGITFLIGWIHSQSLLTLVSSLVLELASVPLIAAMYFLIYFFLPNGKVPIRRVFPAAIATGILTGVVTLIYSRTHTLFRFREVYGPFALSVTLLFWAYVGSLLLLFGAHLSAHIFVSNGATQVAPASSGGRSTGWLDQIKGELRQK